MIQDLIDALVFEYMPPNHTFFLIFIFKKSPLKNLILYFFDAIEFIFFEKSKPNKFFIPLSLNAFKKYPEPLPKSATEFNLSIVSILERIHST